jgi:hypothetical protein
MTKGRKRREVEFLQLLSELPRFKDGNFAKQIGKQSSNVSSYLSGNPAPQKRLLDSALRHAYEWQVKPIVEVQSITQHAKTLPAEPGIYCLYDSSGSAIYVGQATNLKQEIGQALQRQMNFPVRLGPNLSKKEHHKYKDVAVYLSAYEVPSPRMRHNLEALLLRTFPNQSHNNKMGNFKT